MNKKWLTILLILALAFIWGNSLLSREVSGAISDTIMEQMNRVTARLGLGEELFTYMSDQDGDGVEEPTSYIIRKMAHVTEFAVLAALLWLRLESRGARRVLTALSLGAAAGGIDELIQLFSHRGSQLLDVLIDTVGAALGLALALAVSALRRRR